MLRRNELEGKKILVAGLARSGTAAVELAAACGALVTAADTRPVSELRGQLERLEGKVRVITGNPSRRECLESDLVVLSPGVPPRQPWVETAVKSGVPVIGEVELASMVLEGSILGITGTNGKTTTTMLTGAILEASGIDIEVTGNVGTALSESVLKALRENRKPLFVTELSSFQLEGIRELKCHIALLLNCTPDHLDRYPDFRTYREAKLRIFLNQGPEDFTVVNAEDDFLVKEAEKLKSRLFPFSIRRELEQGVFLREATFYARDGGQELRLIDTADLQLRGEHNLENAAASLAASLLAGADRCGMPRAVRGFAGVEHRLEFVTRIGEVDYFNDSKATTVESTIRALQSFPGNVILILGGYDKGADFTPLRPMALEKVRQLILIGATAPKIRAGLDGTAEILSAGSLAEAVRKAADAALPGDTVLLSPACASFDMFKDYEHRGREFKSLVLAMQARNKGNLREVHTA